MNKGTKVEAVIVVAGRGFVCREGDRLVIVEGVCLPLAEFKPGSVVAPKPAPVVKKNSKHQRASIEMIRQRRGVILMALREHGTLPVIRINRILKIHTDVRRQMMYRDLCHLVEAKQVIKEISPEGIAVYSAAVPDNRPSISAREENAA
jgi:hypothetical protein